MHVISEQLQSKLQRKIDQQLFLVTNQINYILSNIFCV